jgi:Spy/CpxP family protein refolding chaperone
MMMHQQLNLSEEQKQKFKTLNDNYRKNMSDLRKQEDITVKDWRNRMADLQKKHRTDMQNVFTAEQKTRMEKMKTERKQMAEIDAKARMEKMKLQLDLSQEQTDKLNSQRKVMREKMNALRENQSMHMGMKREEMRTMMEKRRESIRSILTEEQIKKMNEMRMRQPRRSGKLS